jgi:hypothetical protein
MAPGSSPAEGGARRCSTGARGTGLGESRTGGRNSPIAQPFPVAALSNLDHLPGRIEAALPELVNDTNLARIADALRFIDNEVISVKFM